MFAFKEDPIFSLHALPMDEMLELNFHNEKRIRFHFLLHLKPNPSLLNLLQI
ncbi:hypothetical protein IC582_007809 [Cucumis melo]